MASWTSSSSTSVSRCHAVVGGSRTERGALDEQRVDAFDARVLEQVVEAEAGAAVGAQVAGVEQALAVGFDEQRARVGGGVVDRDRGHADGADAQGLLGGQLAQVGDAAGVGEEDVAHAHDRDGADGAVDGDARVRVVGEAVVVDVRVREDDRGDVGRGGVIGVEAGDVGEDALGDELSGGALGSAARVVLAALVVERHAEVEQDARAVVGGDFDAHAADAVGAAVDDVVDEGAPCGRGCQCVVHTSGRV